MTEDRVFKWLLDIENAIEETEVFLQTGGTGSHVLKQNIMLKRAVERNIEIIGEAVNRILALKPDIDISNARRIVDTRDFIIHEYEKVSDEIIWSILIKHIPLLKSEIQVLIAGRMV